MYDVMGIQISLASKIKKGNFDIQISHANSLKDCIRQKI